MFDKIRNTLEANGFEVISRFSDKFGLRASKLRLLFIYLSFATFGVAFVFYFFVAFFLWIKDGVFIKRKSVFDL